MRNIKKYYDNTEIYPPNKNVKRFVEIEPKAGKSNRTWMWCRKRYSISNKK